MGLFSKKSCDICGGNMGMVTDCKVQNGGICKECKKKLSPWFENAKQTSLADIKIQMTDREENRRRLEEFQTTAAFGEFGCILIDEVNQQFVALASTSETAFGSNKVVTSLDQIKDRNPDIIQFSQIEDVKIDEVVNSKEETHTVDGKQVSYNPKHMTYMASFTIRIKVNHPYIERVYIPLNTSIHIKCEEPRKVSTLAEQAASWLLNRPEAKIENVEKAYDHNSFLDMIYHSSYELPSYSFGFKCTRSNKDAIQKYRAFLLMAKQIQDILTGEVKQDQDLLSVIRENTSFQVLDPKKKEVEFWTKFYTNQFGDKPFFSVVRDCGGIVIDNWIRLYGAGEISLTDRNREIDIQCDEEHPKEMDLILGEDILGGLFGIKNDVMHFFDPNTAAWRSLEKSYEDFINWLISSQDQVQGMYENCRWSTWEEDAKTLSYEEGFAIMPPLYKDAKMPIDQRYKGKAQMYQVIGLLYKKM